MRYEGGQTRVPDRPRPRRRARPRQAAPIQRAVPASGRLPLRPGSRPPRLDAPRSQRPLGRPERRARPRGAGASRARASRSSCSRCWWRPPAHRPRDGYELWLRYRPVADAGLRTSPASIAGLAIEGRSPTLRAAREEPCAGWRPPRRRDPAGGRRDARRPRRSRGSVAVGPGGRAVIGADLGRIGREGLSDPRDAVGGKRATVQSRRTPTSGCSTAPHHPAAGQDAPADRQAAEREAPRSTVACSTTGQPQPNDRARLRGILALGMGGYPTTSTRATRLREGRRLDRDQRDGADERATPTPPAWSIPGEGGRSGGRLPAPTASGST